MSQLRRQFDYKWIIIAASFLMVLVTLGFCSSNSGIYLSAITDALDIKRSLFSITNSFRYVATTVVNLFFGVLLKKFGVRKLVGFGFLALVASTITYSCASTLPIFYLGGFLLGVGIAFTSTTMGSFIVRRWCKTNVGRYTGIVLASNGIGGAIAAQIVTPLIYDENNAFGYRNAYRLVVIILIVTAVVVLSLLREQPKDGTVINELPKKKARGAFWTGISYSTVVKRPYFYIIAASVFLTGLLMQGISVVKPAHMVDVGISTEVIANLASISSLTLTFSKVVVGVLYDRFGLRPIMLICHLLTVITFVLFAFIDNSTTGVVCAAVSAILLTFALPLETIVIPLMTNDMFGAASYDKLLGLFMAFNTAGFAVGSPLINSTYDILGSYIPMFITAAIIMATITILFQVAITTNNKDKKAIMKTTNI